MAEGPSSGNSLAIIWAASIAAGEAALAGLFTWLTRRRKVREKESVGVTELYLGGAKDLLDRYEEDRKLQYARIAALEVRNETLERALEKAMAEAKKLMPRQEE